MRKNKKPKGCIARLFQFIAIVIVAVLVAVAGSNFIILYTGRGDIKATVTSSNVQISDNELSEVKELDADCIMVLGASVKSDGTPSKMLRDRLDVAIMMYKNGAAPKILLSGDNGQVGYNEVEVMKEYVLNAGVRQSAVFLDHAGFSTYDSVYRAKDVFQVDSMIVVTQRYHIYRALYACERLGIDAVGVASNQATYVNQDKRDFREVLARTKDFFMLIFKPDPTYLGDAIPISGSGISTQ
jgi:vancomycin permeability regulator SanA